MEKRRTSGLSGVDARSHCAWAVVVPATSARAVAPLMRIADALACVVADQLWLRGEGRAETDRATVEQFVAGDVYRVLPDGQLVLRGTRVPRARLPDGPWSSARTLVKLFTPVAAIPAAETPQAPWRMVRADHERPANLLLVATEAWARFAETCPAVRLESLSFASSHDGRTIVRGEPIPSLPGERWRDEEGVATPAGWRWTPPVEPAAIQAALGAPAGSLLLLHIDGSYEPVPADAFVRASRAAAREATHGRV